MKTLITLLIFYTNFGYCEEKYQVKDWNPQLIESANYGKLTYWDAYKGKLLNFKLETPGDSIEEAKELIKLQNTRTQLQEKICIEENDMSLELFFKRMNVEFPKTSIAFVKFVFERALRGQDTVVNYQKLYYGRLRPWMIDPQINRCLEPPKTASYPSGHSTGSRLWANILGDIFPERKEEFIAKADQIGLNREIAGVHYHSDTLAGRKLGDMLYESMKITEDYKIHLKTIKDNLQVFKK